MIARQLSDVAWWASFLMFATILLIHNYLTGSNWMWLDAVLVVSYSRRLARCFSNEGARR